MSEIHKRIAEVVKPIHTLLKQHGYKKREHRFFLCSESHDRCLDIQSSQWNQGLSGQFTINLGVRFPEISRMFGTFRETDAPSSHECNPRTRIGRLLPEPHDIWWTVDPTTDTHALGAEVADLIERRAFPWFWKLSSLQSVQESLTEEGWYYNAAYFALAQGHREEANMLLIRGLDAHTEWRETILKIAREHDLPLDGRQG